MIDLDETAWFQEQAKKSVNPTVALKLQETMSDLSEEIWFAAWLDKSEFCFYELITTSDLLLAHSPYFRTISWTVVSMEKIVLLRTLHDQCQGWWHWEQNQGAGASFFNTHEWLDLYVNYHQKERKQHGINRN